MIKKLGSFLKQLFCIHDYAGFRWGTVKKRYVLYCTKCDKEFCYDSH